VRAQPATLRVAMRAGCCHRPRALRKLAHAGVVLVVPTCATDTENSTVITGLSEDTAYGVWFAAEDGFFNLQTAATNVSIATAADTDAPAWVAGYPQADAPRTDGFTVRATIDEDGTAWYVVLTNNAPQPSPVNVRNGFGAGGAPAVLNDSMSLIANVESNALITGLSQSTDYDVWLVAEDGVNNLQAAATRVDITTAADTNAPIWAAGYPQVDTPTTNGFTVRAQIDEDGTAYYVVLADGAGSPSPEQVKAGNDSSDSPALISGSLVLSANTQSNAVLTGLSLNTAYNVWFVAEDGVPNLQGAATNLGVTTAIDPTDAVVLVYSNSWDNITVNSGATGQVNTFAGLNLDDSANFLVLAVPGESADVISASFGGVAMTLAKTFNQSYTRAELYTLANPNTAAGQTLSIVADGDSGFSGGYSPQIFAFSRVASVGADAQVGAGSAGTYSLDFGSVEAGSYLIMAGSVNGSTISFMAPASDLFASTGDHVLGWAAKSGGESVAAATDPKTVEVYANSRVAAIGIELIRQGPPVGTLFQFR